MSGHNHGREELVLKAQMKLVDFWQCILGTLQENVDETQQTRQAAGKHPQNVDLTSYKLQSPESSNIQWGDIVCSCFPHASSIWMPSCSCPGDRCSGWKVKGSSEEGRTESQHEEVSKVYGYRQSSFRTWTPLSVLLSLAVVTQTFRRGEVVHQTQATEIGFFFISLVDRDERLDPLQQLINSQDTFKTLR